MKIFKSILKRLGITLAVAVVLPIIFVVATCVFAILVPLIILGTIITCLTASDDSLEDMLKISTEVDPDMVID